jgi:hypothetical protein
MGSTKRRGLTSAARTFLVAALIAFAPLALGVAAYLVSLGRAYENELLLRQDALRRDALSSSQQPRGGSLELVYVPLPPEPRPTSDDIAGGFIAVYFGSVAFGLLAVLVRRFVLPSVTLHRFTITAVVIGLVLFGLFVWPTLWVYYPDRGGRGLIRVHRITGEAEYVEPVWPRR